MDDTVRKISAEDINPRYNWGRALPALGTMGVDFEERVDYRRLHRYRLCRVKQALEKSDLGALLVFDVNNIRYITSTKIGEWERDKLSRWALLTRDGEPILWDFGSAAVHHKLYAPWLKPENCKAGLIGLRGTRRSVLRADEAPRRGDRRADPRGRRRRHAGRRRHHRAADDVRAAEGRPQGRRTASRSCSKRARSRIGRRDRAAQPRRRHGRRRLSPDLRAAQAGRARERHRRQS